MMKAKRKQQRKVLPTQNSTANAFSVSKFFALPSSPHSRARAVIKIVLVSLACQEVHL
jgi:hypothetical protein